MTLEDTIAKSIKKYPSLFKDVNWKKSRIKVIDHLFLTIGNGFEWYDGYLAEKSKKHKYGEIKFKWRPTQKWFDTKLFDKYGWDKAIIDIIKKNPQMADLLEIESASLYLATPYPVCEYSRAMNVPDNVRPDWLAGAIETLEWAEMFYSGPLNQLKQSGFIVGTKLCDDAIKKDSKARLKLVCKTLINLKNVEKTLKRV